MSKTDTERNEAIRVLGKTLEEYKSKYAESVRVKERIELEPKRFMWKWEDGGYWVLVYENYPKYIKELQTAITALRSQLEAERKVEKVREYCNGQKVVISVLQNAYSDDVVKQEACRAVTFEHKKILEILEGKADEI